MPETIPVSLKRSILTIRVVVLSGFAVGISYDVWLAFEHQSNPNDAMLVVMALFIAGVPAFALALAPAFLLAKKLLTAVTTKRRALLAIASTILPLALCVAGVVIQGDDWDELAIFLVPTIPTILVIWYFAFASSKTR